MEATAGGWGEDGGADWGAEGMAETGAERAWDDEPLNDRPLYDGRRVRDPYQRGGGYSRISEDRWDAIQRAYAAGEPGASVCRRFGLARSTLYARARDEGWLRQDQAETEPLDYGFEAGEADEPVDLEAETAAGLCDYGLLAAHARVRMQRAILAGRGVEAGRWMRLHAQLTAMAQAEAAAKAEAAQAATAPAPALAPKPPAPRPPAPRRRSGPKPLSDCDPFEVLERQTQALNDLERSFAGLDLSDPVYRRLLEKGLEAVALMGGPDPVDPAPDQPDTPDTSDTVFSTPVPG
jgi:transposase-like protein